MGLEKNTLNFGLYFLCFRCGVVHLYFGELTFILRLDHYIFKKKYIFWEYYL